MTFNLMCIGRTAKIEEERFEKAKDFGALNRVGFHELEVLWILDE